MPALMVVAGSILVAQGAERAEFETWSVDPHTTGVLLADHRAPVVEVRLEFPVGRWSDWARAAGAVEAFRIQRFDPERRLLRQSDELAVDLRLSVGGRHALLWASALSRDLDRLRELIVEVLGNRDLDRAQVTRWSREAKIGWSSNQKLPGFVVERLAHERCLAEGDPRLDGWREPRKLQRNVTALLETRDEILRRPGRLIALAGDVDRAAAERFASGLLPAPLEDAPTDSLGLQAADCRAGEGEESAALRGLTQSTLAWARPALTLDDPRYPAFLIADHVLAGHFRSRLYDALRHDGGETYGVNSSADADPVPGVYRVRTFTRAGNEAVVTRKVRSALTRFAAEGIAERERAEAVSFLLGRLAFREQSPGDRMARYLSERRQGLEPGGFARLRERAAALSLDEVNAFIAEFYHPDSFVPIRVVPR
ncbi:hypothetical protein ABI59_22860 [Acidobacteria bacterium Mor1]|nr:hypothetical protein ABI59_22860 [Acidobacteria bacterium Mor1]